MNQEKLVSAQVWLGHRRRIRKGSERSKPGLTFLARAFSLAYPMRALNALQASKGVGLMGQ